MKSDHTFKFKFVLDLLITKYKSQSASISENKKQINSDNMINLLKKILNSDEKNNLINFDKDSQDLSLLIKKDMRFLYIYVTKNLNIYHIKQILKCEDKKLLS